MYAHVLWKDLRKWCDDKGYPHSKPKSVTKLKARGDELFIKFDTSHPDPK